MITRVEQLVAHTVVMELRAQGKRIAELEAKLAKYEKHLLGRRRASCIERCCACRVLYGFDKLNGGGIVAQIVARIFVQPVYL